MDISISCFLNSLVFKDFIQRTPELAGSRLDLSLLIKIDENIKRRLPSQAQAKA